MDPIKSSSRWDRPSKVSRAESVFGGGGRLHELMPTQEEIPAVFKKHWGTGTKWNEIQARWFFEGLPENTRFIMKDGIDKYEAIDHLKAIQSSFEPKHEHKEAAVAWLMSLWFEDIVIPSESSK